MRGGFSRITQCCVQTKAQAKSLCVMLALAGLAGCATQTGPSSEILNLTDLVRHGRFAVRAETAGQTPEALQGGFVWRDVSGQLTLDLTNPFGNTLARVVVLPDQATLTQTDGKTLSAASPDALIQQAIGQSIPVRYLRDWLRTPLVVLPSMRQVTSDDQGRIVSFEQNGWRAELGRFDSVGPRLLVLSRLEGSDSVYIRLVVDAP